MLCWLVYASQFTEAAFHRYQKHIIEYYCTNIQLLNIKLKFLNEKIIIEWKLLQGLNIKTKSLNENRNIEYKQTRISQPFKMVKHTQTIRRQVYIRNVSIHTRNQSKNPSRVFNILLESPIIKLSLESFRNYY